MSIQAAREKIATNARFMAAADPAFAKTINGRYEALQAKGSPHPADLRRLQGEVASWSMSQLNKPNALSGDNGGALDCADGWSKLLQTEIDNHLLVSGNWQTGTGSGWIDAETRQPVRVLAPNEPIAQGALHNGVTVGSIINGLIGGARSPEIKAALAEGTDSAGGYSIPQEVLSEFFDKLRAQTRFIQAGARTLMLSGMKTRVMRISSDPAPAWRLENAAVTESAPTFDKVDFIPKSLAVLVKVSQELLSDSVNVDMALQTALIGALSVELDRACLFGAGTSTEPLGLFGTSGVNVVDMGTNGATPLNYDPMIDALYNIEAANGAMPTAAIMHPRTARTMRKFKDTMGQPLRLPPAIDTLPMLTTTSVPINQTHGTGAACSTAIVGDFTQAILGLRQSLVIRRLDQTFAGNLQVGFLAYLRADVGFAHPESFTNIIGINP